MSNSAEEYSLGALKIAEKNCCWKANQETLVSTLLDVERDLPISAGFFSPEK